MNRRKVKLVNTKATASNSDSTDEDFSDSQSEYTCSEESYTESGSSEEEATNGNSLNYKLISNTPKNSIKKQLNETFKNKPLINDKEYIIKSDDYFSHNSKKKALTSHNSVDKLEIPKLNENELQNFISQTNFVKQHYKNLTDLNQIYEGLFSKWLCVLHEDFNILLYGLGSKLNILQEFKEKCLTNTSHIVINGFFPNLTIKSIVDGISSNLLGITSNPTNLNEMLDLIANKMKEMAHFEMYILLNNIEGNVLKNNKSQNFLSKLASIKNIHLIATIDHVSAPLIWDYSKLNKFNFLWFDVTTFLPYFNEISFEDSQLQQRSKTLALSSLNNVFLSLTSNSKGIYLVIAKFQLENENQHYQGLLFKDLYWSCREAFLVSSDLALRTQLGEFVDHKMVKFKRSRDGGEYLVIPIAIDILQQFYEEQSK